MILEITTVQLTPTEKKVIETMRANGPHCEFVIEKRPTHSNPNGDLVKISVTTNELLIHQQRKHE